jgi:methylthioxylose transferase
MRVRVGAPARTGETVAGRVLPATAVAAASLLVVGAVGTLAMRGWGRVPFAVPSWPWYHSWPFYLFWSPRLDLPAAAVALPVALAAAAAVVALARRSSMPGAHASPGLAPVPRAWMRRRYLTGGPARAERVGRAARLAGSLAATFALALAVAALAGGPAAWRAPLAFSGEYPAAVGQLGPIPTFLGDFPDRVPGLPDFAAQHPPFATVFYALVARVWPGLTGAALATVAAGCLGLLVVAGLARDELGEASSRRAVACWALAPVTVLYLATSADAMWAPVLAGAALAADRGLQRRSWGWTVAGGALLWLASMLTFAAALVLPFLGLRALAAWLPARPGGPDAAGAVRAWVPRWAAATTAVVLGLAGLLWLTTGYDVVAAVRAVHQFWSVAPGTRQRSPLLWAFGDLVAFGAILGFPLAAALVVRARQVVAARAWRSFEAAALASLLAAAAWGHTRGEVERMWQFLVPFAVVVAARQLDRWRAPLPLVGGLLVGQALATQVLFFTRW